VSPCWLQSSLRDEAQRRRCGSRFGGSLVNGNGRRSIADGVTYVGSDDFAYKEAHILSKLYAELYLQLSNIRGV
jgi:hypothetical protein